MSINLKILRTAAVFGFLSVAVGAFAAHGLKNILPPERILIFETGVRYQYYHTFALLAVAMLSAHFSDNLIKIAVRCFTIGIFLFSGSLYLLALRDVLGIADWWFLGPLTPIGGVFFMAGWGSLIALSFRNAEKKI